MDNQERRRRILQFDVEKNSLEGNGYKRVLLQLFGFQGHGKSSFINSCIHTLQDGIFKVKVSASAGYVTHTTERLAYKLTDCITLVDNRGHVMMLDSETGEVYAQLGNFLPFNKEVKWKRDFVEIMSIVEDSDMEPNYSDFVVPIFVYSVKNTLTEEVFSNVKTFFKNCRDMTGVYPIVVLTNKLSAPYTELASKFKETGAEQIHVVENYTISDNLKTRGRCNDLQVIIENALKDAKFRMEQKRDPIKERIERKKFLLKFAYQFTVAEKEKEAAKKEKARLKALASKMWLGRFPE
ncbi:uncharacterized protein [Ranitomeya imitator]|uniref:uncharacterized protein isoform X2 n=1 Tax=Ranitomeya imitator TaxID=111125 RepID=UPI0037E8D2F7